MTLAASVLLCVGGSARKAKEEEGVRREVGDKVPERWIERGARGGRGGSEMSVAEAAG